MKSIQKSIRISENVYQIIESFKGSSFSDKLENLVIHYSDEYPALLIKIQRAESVLDQTENELKEKRKILNQLRSIEAKVISLFHCCNTK